MAATKTADDIRLKNERTSRSAGDTVDSVIYRTSTVLPAIESTPPAPSHLRDLMFRNVLEQEASLVMCDVIEEKARLAPFVHLYSRGSTVRLVRLAHNRSL